MSFVGRKWLPIEFGFGSRKVVRWIDFGDAKLVEPFFFHTLRRLRSSRPPAEEKLTDLSELLQAAKGLPSVQPCGVIFHVSRCGSTLLSNALKTAANTITLSESRVIGAVSQRGVLKAFGGEQNPLSSVKHLLNTVIALYSHAMGEGGPAKVILKCHAISMFEIAFMRKLLPQTPFIVLVRDPLEVLVSNVLSPAGWVRARFQTEGKSPLGLTGMEASRISVDEFIARGIGQMCDSALRSLESNCRVIDYDDLDVSTILRIAAFFQLSIGSDPSPEMQVVLTTYSKSPMPGVPFAPDKESKRLFASPEMVTHVARWAQKSYDELRISGSMTS